MLYWIQKHKGGHFYGNIRSTRPGKSLYYPIGQQFRKGIVKCDIFCGAGGNTWQLWANLVPEKPRS